MAISMRPSRFALLNIEDESSSEENDSKSKQPNNKSSNTQNANKKKNKKKKKAEQAKAEEDLRNLAFAKVGKGKGHKGNHGDGDPGNRGGQWEQWKTKDVEFVEESYEKDLQQALLMSKLQLEETKDVDSALKDDDPNGTPGKDKKKKKKDKPAVMSLDEFKQMPVQVPKDPEENGVEYVIPDTKPKLQTTVTGEADPRFFKRVDQDVQKIIQKEKIQDVYKKQYAVENARTSQFKEEMRQKEEDMEKLREENKKLEAELKQVKKRNHQLCHILAQGEMKDKTAVLTELEELKQVRDELTEGVSKLNTDLEKERSKVHALRADLDKERGKGGKHGK